MGKPNSKSSSKVSSLPPLPELKKDKPITAESFNELTPDQLDKVKGDAGLATHICDSLVQELKEPTKETLGLLHLAFDLADDNKRKQRVTEIQSVYQKCALYLKSADFKVDDNITGPCVTGGDAACSIANVKGLEKTIIVTNLPDGTGYFAGTPRSRAITLIHEAVHGIGQDKDDHPGGVRIQELPPPDAKDLIPYHQASHNAHCFGNFAFWKAKSLKLE